MKAALAGAAAAAVWQVPRIEELSIAPDVAQAATTTSGTQTQNLPVNDASLLGTGVTCWGASTSQNTCGTSTLNFAIGNFNVAVTLGGGTARALGVTNQNTGYVNAVIDGIDPPFESCTINVVGSCDAGAFSTPTITRVVNTNGSVGVSNNQTDTVCNESTDTTQGCFAGCFNPRLANSMTVTVACVSA